MTVGALLCLLKLMLVCFTAFCAISFFDVRPIHGAAALLVVLIGCRFLVVL